MTDYSNMGPLTTTQLYKPIHCTSDPWRWSFNLHVLCLLFVCKNWFHFDLCGTRKNPFQEKDARDIEIPNIRWDVFELMMRLISWLVFSPPPALFWSVCLVCIYSQMFMVRAYLCAGSSIRGPLRWLWRLLRTSSEPPTSISWRASSASASIQSRRWAIWPLPGSFQYHSYAYIYI